MKKIKFFTLMLLCSMAVGCTPITTGPDDTEPEEQPTEWGDDITPPQGGEFGATSGSAPEL